MVTESGAVYATGDNNHGQLGTGGTQRFLSPVKMSLDALDAKVASAAAGCWFTLLLLESGAVYGVGQNSYGQLGSGSAASSGDCTVPVQMPINGTATAVAAGSTHSLILLESGEAYGTGDNIYGQLGSGNKQDQHMPTKILTSLKVVALAAGTYHSVLLLETGEVATVGSNSHGQLGLGMLHHQVTPAKMVLHVPGKAIAAGDFHSLVLLESGEVYAAGDNSYGQLGTGGWGTKLTPTKMILDEQVATIDAGWSYSVMVAKSGEVFSAGYHLIHAEEHSQSDPRPQSLQCCA